MATVCPTFEHVGDQLLDVDKDCNKVVIALTSIHHKWYQLGTHLNIPNGTLQSIAGKHNNDHFIQMSDLISTWIRRPTPDHHPSWRVLCQALAGMGEVGLADKIAGNKNEDQSNGSNNPESVAKELKNSFDELLVFMIKEIRHVDIDLLRLKISRHFQDEEENVDEKIEQYLAKICRDVLYDTPDAILNFFIRSNFIGYINYSLIKVFQKVANSPLLDLHIKKYEEKYYLFLKLTFKDYIQIFQQHRDLRPDYPAGIPQFSFHLESEWNGRTMITLKDVLQHCLPAGSNPGFIHQLMITRIEQNCVIIAFAVLPHIAREVFKYLTNDDVITSMKKEGISVNISEQLMKYEEFDTTSVELSLENGPTPFGLEVPHTTGILAVKPHWDTFTDTGYGGSSVYSDHKESEVNENSRLVDLKDDVTLKEAVDTYEKVVNMLRKRINSYESQFVTHKQMMMELDTTRESLKQVTLERNETRGIVKTQLETHEQMMKELDNTRDELEKTKHEHEDKDPPEYKSDTVPNANESDASIWPKESVGRKRFKFQWLKDRIQPPPPPPLTQYDIVKGDHHGYALIIINILIDGREERLGSKYNIHNMSEMLKGLKYKLVGGKVHENCTAQRMKELFKEAMDIDHTYCDSFICYIESHGDSDFVYGSDDKKVWLSELQRVVIKCNTLVGKPKVFFIEACRGNLLPDACRVQRVDDDQSKQVEDSVAEQMLLPEASDMFIGYSTSPNTKSCRFTDAGTWFVLELCKAMKEYPHEDLMTIVQRAQHGVSTGKEYEYTRQERGIMKTYRQSPQLTSTLTKKLYF